MFYLQYLTIEAVAQHFGTYGKLLSSLELDERIESTIVYVYIA